MWFEGIRDTFATFPDSSNYNCIVQFDLSDGPATFLAGIHWRLVREVAVLQRPRRTDPCSQMTARTVQLWFEGIRNAFATFPDSTTIVEFALSDGEQLVILLRTWQVHWRLVREVAVLQRPRRTDPCSQMTARDGPCGSKAFDTHS